MFHTFSEPCPSGTFYKQGICCDDINEVNLNGFCKKLCPPNYVLNKKTKVCDCANDFSPLNPLSEGKGGGRLCCPANQVSSVNSRGFPACANKCPKNYVAKAGKFLLNLTALVPSYF